MGGEKDWVFVSDAHLNGKEPKEVDAFLQFLASQKKGMGHLVILGDLFEFFFGFHCPFPSPDLPLESKSFPFPEYLPVLEALRQFSGEGVRITYLEGNHDFSLRFFFRDWFQSDVEVYPNAWETWIGGCRAFLAHGDLSNPKQWKYRFYRRTIKNRITYRLIRWIGPRSARRIAQRMNCESRKRYHHRRGEGGIGSLRSFAHRKFLSGFDVVILGHSHFPEKVEESIGGRRCLYLNAGDWMTQRSYLRFSPPDRFELTFA